jgi:hypothetical protein
MTQSHAEKQSIKSLLLDREGALVGVTKGFISLSVPGNKTATSVG